MGFFDKNVTAGTLLPSLSGMTGKRYGCMVILYLECVCVCVRVHKYAAGRGSNISLVCKMTLMIRVTLIPLEFDLNLIHYLVSINNVFSLITETI